MIVRCSTGLSAILVVSNQLPVDSCQCAYLLILPFKLVPSSYPDPCHSVCQSTSRPFKNVLKIGKMLKSKQFIIRFISNYNMTITSHKLNNWKINNPLRCYLIMSKHKPLGKKIRLMKVTKRNRRVPAWVMMRTKRRFTQHPKRHTWRRSKLHK